MVMIIAVNLLLGCVPVSFLDGRNSSMIPQETSDTRLVKAALSMVQEHPGKSGVFALRGLCRTRVTGRFLRALARYPVLHLEWRQDGHLVV